MKLIQLIIPSLLILSMTACSSDGTAEGKNPPVTTTPEITISTPDVVFPSTYNNQWELASFTTNTTWSIELSDTRAIPSWFDVSPKSGEAGTVALKVSLIENNELYDDRNAFIKIKAGTVVKNITITQKKKDAIITSKDKVELGVYDTEFSLAVQSNIDYEVEIPEDTKTWITKVPGPSKSSRGLVSTIEYFSVTPASETTDRRGTIIFKSDNIIEEVDVFQTKRELLLTSPIESIDHNGGIIEVDLRTNLEYEVSIPENDQEWISVNDPAGRSIRTDKILFKVEENTSYDNRQTGIVFKDKYSSYSTTLTIKQSQINALILGKTEFEVDYTGETITVELKSNVNYSINIPNDIKWIRQAPASRALEDYSHKFIIDPNDLYEERKGAITFKDEKTGLLDNVSIIQAQKPGIFITEDEYMLDEDGETISIAVKANVTYDIIIDPSDTWLRQMPENRRLVNNECKIIIDPNETQLQREANIIFKNDEFGISEIVTIKQYRLRGVFDKEELIEMVSELNKPSGERVAGILDKYRKWEDGYYKYQIVKDINLNPGIEFQPDGTFSGGTPYRFTPIETFYGVLEGNGHKISGVYISSSGETGFVAHLSGQYQAMSRIAVIQNLHIESGYISGGESTGAICGAAVSGYIKSCSNKAYVRGGDYTGGIIGSRYGSTVTNSQNYGNVKGVNNTGGISGHGYAEECENYGNISGVKYVGGIIGYASINAVRGCANYGDVYGSNHYVGGIVGQGGVTSSFNMGNIHSDTNYVGGIAGGGSPKGCYNQGNVSGFFSVAGISGSAVTSQIISCYNTGVIITTNTAPVATVYGIASGTGAGTALYYLEGLGLEGIGLALSADDLKSKASDLNAGVGDSNYEFYDVINDYPKIRRK